MRKVEVLEYRIEGAVLLSQPEVEEAVYPFMGPEMTSEDVEAARAALEKAYSTKGYQTVTVEIPPQQVKDGIVILKVTEAKLGRLRVKGSRYFDLQDIKDAAPSLAEGIVPNFDDVSRDVVALNQLPDRRVTPALKAGRIPGTVDMDLNVSDTFPLHSTIELNNRYSDNTTPYRLNSTVRYDNLWQMGHSLSISYQTAPQNPNDAKVFSASYLLRVPGWDKVSFLFSGVNQNSDVNTLGSMDVAGRGQVIGGRAIVLLPGEADFSHTISIGMDYKNFHEVLNSGGTATDTPITYYPLTATWSGSWQGEESLTQVNGGVTMALRGMGVSPTTFDNKRYNAKSDFIYFRGDISRTQELPEGMQFFAKAQGQLANAPLISNEQISAGGLDTVRGYLESVALGDTGALLSLELRSPSLVRWFGSSFIDEWRVYAFTEGGRLTINEPLAEQDFQFDLASFGIGSRGRLLDYLNGSLDFAIPLIGQGSTRAHSQQLTFRAWSEF